MPYKRKVRLLFLASGDPCRARLALTITRRLGAAQLDARAYTSQVVALTPELSAALTAAENFPGRLNFHDTPLQVLKAATLSWADLVLTLDQDADQCCPGLPAHTQKRCFPCAPVRDVASLDHARIALEQRVAGILGGLTMMA